MKFSLKRSIYIIFLHYKYARGKTKKYFIGEEKSFFQILKELFLYYLTEGEFFTLYFLAGYNLKERNSIEFLGKKSIFKRKRQLDKLIKKYYGLSFDYDIITKDKFYANSILKANGIPCLENLALIQNSEIITNQGRIIALNQIHEMGNDLVLKNTVLEASEGIFFLQINKEKLMLNKDEITHDTLKKKLSRCIWVIQERINSHERIKKVNSSALNVMKLNTYDVRWNFLDITFNKYYPNDRNIEIKKPKHFDEMLSYSRALAHGFDYVRVDFYFVDGNIIFGELTFTPGHGSYPLTEEDDLFLGSFFRKSK